MKSKQISDYYRNRTTTVQYRTSIRTQGVPWWSFDACLCCGARRAIFWVDRAVFKIVVQDPREVRFWTATRHHIFLRQLDVIGPRISGNARTRDRGLPARDRSNPLREYRQKRRRCQRIAGSIAPAWPASAMWRTSLPVGPRNRSGYALTCAILSASTV